MTQLSGPDLIDEGVERALAEVSRSGERVYYDAEADAEARAAYYAGVDGESPPEALFGALRLLVEETHRTRPSYQPSDRVYPWVDLHPDRRLRSIYSGQAYDPVELVRADAEIARKRTAHMQDLVSRRAHLSPREFEDAFDRLEAQLPYNCEHVVPQSWFAKREPMRGDLHHLFACESHCNSFRGNTPYVEFDDRAVREGCGRSEKPGFEPTAGKGPVARATLYFLLRYPGMIGDAERELQRARVGVLLAWHRAEPVGEYERHRNVAIADIQGNRNPLIDYPEWGERIGFDAGFGGSAAAVPTSSV